MQEPDRAAQAIAAERWSRHVVDGPIAMRTHNQCPPVAERLARRLVPGARTKSHVVQALVRSHLDASSPRAVSVGCGQAYREVGLLRAGLVDRFDLFEIAAEMRTAAAARAAEHGVTDRIALHDGDFRTADGPYDLVLWASSLHHMLDVDEAIAWSRRVLRPGGLLLVQEYVGANRFQFPDEQLDLAEAFRAQLPERLRAKRDPDKPPYPARPRVVPLEMILADDPTEAADSEQILPSLARHFPDATVWREGGVVYRIALTNLYHNFDLADPTDLAWLDRAVDRDEELSRAGHDLYATAIARRR